MTTATTAGAPAAVAMFCAALLGGCSTAEPDAVARTIHVAAAASLTDVFTELGRDFESQHPGTRIIFDFGSSTTLATQLEQRGDVSLFASADRRSMDRAVSSGAAHDPVGLVTNRLVLAVPHGNPAGIRSLTDLADPGRRVVLCEAEVPCGRASTRVFVAAGVPEPGRANRQADVRATLGILRAGEADAGLVYSTDARSAADRVDVLPLDPAVAAAGGNDYFLAPVGSDAPALAADFRDYLLGPEGASTLARAGFHVPAR